MIDEAVTDLGELRAFVREASAKLFAIDQELRPVWARQRTIRDMIKATHHCIDDAEVLRRGLPLHVPNTLHVIGLNLTAEARERRRPLFAELDELARQWGPTRSRRRELKLDLDWAVRQINRLTKTEK